MALSRPFSETVKARAASDPAFRAALLTEAVECFLENDVRAAKKMLRDYVNATIGFTTLADETGKSPKSLLRMLSDDGNPRAENLSSLFASLQRHEGVELRVEAGR